MIIGIVILNYNTYEKTIKLVKDLQNQTVVNFLKIVIVDNASPNDSYRKLQFLSEEYFNVKILQTKKNIGYAKGNNFGLKYLDQKIKPKYVTILNNDIILPNDCFEKLIDKYQELINPAIIAPVMLSVNGDRIIPPKLNSFLDDCVSLFIVLNKYYRHNRQKEIDNTGQKAMSVELISGSFMFTTMSKFKEIGYFYPNTFLYAEEMFIAYKVKQLELKNYLVLDLTYVHAHNSPTISISHNIIGKYQLLWEGILEFTLINRKFGRIKALILKLLMVIAFCEKLIYSLILKKRNDK